MFSDFVHFVGLDGYYAVQLEFDFDEIVVLGIKVPLKKGEAAKVRLIEWTSSIVCLILYMFWLPVLFSDSYLLLFAGLI
jgi:hypothetical protein